MDDETKETPKFSIGDKVTVRKSVDVPLSFKGTVSKVYTNSALVTIDDYEPEQRTIAEDLKYKTIVNFKHIRKIGKTAKKSSKK
ncbi:hypothetical protein FHQ08_01385 [Lactobacillus sp. CC-MHH1034]|uniref:hypothetical protein n=1 Tax=Agrilactobacillus fermenti TaxID=2586909 RepID=UPI001E339260|nr:hypothetical protein [Agrilactobacillus fermenti]MCD2255363.1 hypothetical protein [Agrilactobacillus fermenti]